MPKEDTQFQPGQSGNPSGRPKNSLSLRTLLRQKLSELAEGDRKERTYAQSLIDATIRDALKGDASARKLVWEYIDGKAPADPEGEGEGVVRIVDNI